MTTADHSTLAQKCLACTTAFGFACFTFVLAATLLVPATGWLGNALPVPDVVPQMLILFELFALPVVAAISGVALVARSINKRTAELTNGKVF